MAPILRSLILTDMEFTSTILLKIYFIGLGPDEAMVQNGRRILRFIFLPPICLTTFCICSSCFKRRLTSSTIPEPAAMRRCVRD